MVMLQERPAVRNDVPVEECHANGRKRRADALPEHVDYHDGGCELAPSCLRCPLERCRYEEPGGARRVRLGARNDLLRRFRDDGMRIDDLAGRFGISRRSVFRALARGRLPAVE